MVGSVTKASDSNSNGHASDLCHANRAQEAPSEQVETDTGTGPEYWALVKGAPEVVEGFLSEAPAGYVATYKRFASQGGRCLYTQT